MSIPLSTPPLKCLDVIFEVEDWADDGGGSIIVKSVEVEGGVWIWSSGLWLPRGQALWTTWKPSSEKKLWVDHERLIAYPFEYDELEGSTDTPIILLLWAIEYHSDWTEE